MTIGDLVKRKNVYAEWQKYNSWMIKDEEGEVGIIVAMGRSVDYRVLWPSGMSWIDETEIEAV